MQYAVDVIIVAAVAIFTIVGIKKGFVRSCAEFFGSIISLIAASLLGGKLAEWAYNTFFRSGVTEKITRVISKKGAGVDEIFDSLPNFVVNWMSDNGVNQKYVENAMAGSKNEIASAVTDVISPVFISLIKIFIVIILFILFMIIVRALAMMLSEICRLPILKQINGLLGGVCGLLLGAVSIWLIIAAVQFFEPMMPDKWQDGIEKTVGQSVICETVVDFNPVKTIFE